MDCERVHLSICDWYLIFSICFLRVSLSISWGGWIWKKMRGGWDEKETTRGGMDVEFLQPKSLFLKLQTATEYSSPPILMFLTSAHQHWLNRVLLEFCSDPDSRAAGVDSASSAARKGRLSCALQIPSPDAPNVSFHPFCYYFRMYVTRQDSMHPYHPDRRWSPITDSTLIRVDGNPTEYEPFSLC